MGFHEGNMTARDYLANRDAKFCPAVHASDSNGADALPCIEIGGVQVYAYVRDGILVVSVDYDTADVSDAGPFAVYGGGRGPGSGQVPTVVDLSGQRVWEELPGDAWAIRDASDDPDDWPGSVVPDWALFPGSEGAPDTLRELRDGS